MRKKIAYSDFWPDFNPDTLPLTKAIKEVADVQDVGEIDDADFLLFSCMGQKHWFAPDNVIKIFYTGENFTPDFNACDFAIGFDWLDFGDRYLRFPLYYLYDEICELMENKHIKPNSGIIESKTKFCSITISNADRNPVFKELYNKLSSYKHVDSGGRWENNIGGPIDDKLSFDREHKFSIVCENSSSPGYTTEKLVQAFAANCIPIYWGDPAVEKVFNKKSFINVMDYDSIEDVLDRVKEIDSNDELYREMLLEPALNDSKYTKEYQMKVLKHFLTHILASPLKDLERRNRFIWGRRYINNQRALHYNMYQKGNWTKFKEIVYDIIH